MTLTLLIGTLRNKLLRSLGKGKKMLEGVEIFTFYFFIPIENLTFSLLLATF